MLRFASFICLLWLIAAVPSIAAKPVILVLGDSLSAGYGINLNEAWPNLLQEKLDASGRNYTVINASISGETTNGGLQRIHRLLAKHQPTIVLLELGANDGLRGIPVAHVSSNIEKMLLEIEHVGAKALVFEMRVPPNYGRVYESQFTRMYERMTVWDHVVVVPFFLNDVVLDNSLMQADGLHPTAAAQPTMMEHVWPYVEQAIDGLQGAEIGG